jgi:hypothetical protein
VRALVETACDLLAQPCPDAGSDAIHRLGKADTAHGTLSMQRLADLGVPYAMLLYERFLGRPFASHRDSVSELVGGLLEATIEEQLVAHGISYRRTGRAESIEGFDQAPDFCIPSEYNPQIVIEAKITEDDGTARERSRGSSILQNWHGSVKRGEHPVLRSLPALVVAVLACAERI